MNRNKPTPTTWLMGILLLLSIRRVREFDSNKNNNDCTFRFPILFLRAFIPSYLHVGTHVYEYRSNSVQSDRHFLGCTALHGVANWFLGFVTQTPWHALFQKQIQPWKDFDEHLDCSPQTVTTYCVKTYSYHFS